MISKDVISLEHDILQHQLAASGKLYVYDTDRFWSQIKSARLVTLLLCFVVIMKIEISILVRFHIFSTSSKYDLIFLCCNNALLY